MRILFALTLALGISAPTFKSTTASDIGARVDEIAPELLPVEPRQLSNPLGEIAIEGTDGYSFDVVTRREEEAEEPVARLEQPAVDVEDVTAEDQSEPVTVELERVCEALADAAVEHDLPVGFFARLIWQESRFDQWARSPAGARGVAQFMPPTAEEYGLRDPFDPIESVAASARFLRELREQFGNLGLAAAAYNAGGGRIRKWLNGQSALPEETRKYVNIITGHPPQRWTVRKPLQISFALPQRAPCDGVEGLSHEARTVRHPVRLTDRSLELIQEAEAARRAKVAAAAAARKKRHAAAKAAKARKEAAAKSKVRVAEERRAGAGS